MTKKSLLKLILSAMFLSLALVLPLLTGQVPQIGNMLCPMHIPVLLCGFFCGPIYALIVGAVAPFLRFLLFGMPPLYPTGLAMIFELASYGAVSGFLYKALPKKKGFIYLSLVSAMLFGRIVWGIARGIMYGVGKIPFGWSAFMAGAFVNALPGIVLQLVLIPIIVMALEKYCAKTE